MGSIEFYFKVWYKNTEDRSIYMSLLMKLFLTQDKRHMEVMPETKKDFKVLAEFPGFNRVRGRHIAPAKINVCKNLITRLKRQVEDPLNVSKSVLDLYNSEFRLKEIPSSLKYFTTPMEHQEIALRYLYTNNGGGLLLDPGLGKTKVVLDYIALMGYKKSLVVCPKALLFVWQDEVAVHRPDLKIHVRRSTTWEKKISNREKTILMLEERLEEMEEGDEKNEEIKKLKRNQSLLKGLIKGQEEDKAGQAGADIIVMNYERAVRGRLELMHDGYEFLAIDEALVKDVKTGRTQTMTTLSRMVKSVVLMSGTLVNNTPVDIFAPVRIMEPALCGNNLDRFQDRYCHRAPIRDAAGNIKNHFTAGFKNVPEAKNMLQSVSIVMRKEKWLKDLPPKKFIEIKTTPTPEQVEKMEELTANYITTIGDEYIEVESPLTALAKLYQMSNGFVYKYPEDTGQDWDDLFGVEEEAPKRRKKSDRKTIFFEDNPKIVALRKLYKETLTKRKFILWYNSDAEFELIERSLHADNISFLSIRGGEKDTGGKVRTFNGDPGIQVLVCQAKSVNYGITVLGTRPDKLEKDIEALPDVDPRVYTEVFFSLNFSLEVFLQQQDRIHRIGQEHECEYYIIVNDTPVELRISDALVKKLNLREAVLVDIMDQLHKSVMV